MILALAFKLPVAICYMLTSNWIFRHFANLSPRAVCMIIYMFWIAR